MPAHGTQGLRLLELQRFLNGRHVGIYVGDNTMINALNENDITTSYWTSNFDRARRLWQD